MSIEQVKLIADELRGTDGGETMEVVLKACEMLAKRRGSLDLGNAETACFALIQALTPSGQHANILINLAQRVDGVKIGFC